MHDAALVLFIIRQMHVERVKNGFDRRVAIADGDGIRLHLVFEQDEAVVDTPGLVIIPLLEQIVTQAVGDQDAIGDSPYRFPSIVLDMDATMPLTLVAGGISSPVPTSVHR